MGFVFQSVALIGGLFLAMLGCQELGRRQGDTHRRLAGSQEKPSHGAIEGAVFALLGLFLAFTFSGAGARFDERRHLIAEEANAIGTAWLRIDLLRAESQAPIRQLLREYVDARLETYRRVAAAQPYEDALARSQALQRRIWDESLRAAAATGETPPLTLLPQALNEMFDLASTRVAATRIHPPFVVYAMICLLSIVSSFFVGYGLASQPVRSLVHTLAFALVLSIVLYVIVDLEYPRLGLTRVEAMDGLLVDLRRSLQ